MVPEKPAAQPWPGSAKLTPHNVWGVPERCTFQLLPPSDVVRMVPPLPTTQP